MLAELVAFVVLLAAVAVFGALAWRLTLHLIGFEQQDFAVWANRLRETRATLREARSAPTTVAAAPTGVAERVDRVLALLDDDR